MGALPTFNTFAVDAGADAGDAQALLPLLLALQSACKQVAARVARAGIEGAFGYAGTQGGSGDAQKKLDVVANDIFKATLGQCPSVAGMASEEDDAAIPAHPEGSYLVVFDPLDGSRNIECSVPTGSIFGVYRRHPGTDLEADVLQPGSQLVAAGYSLYSSATMLVVSTGQGTHGFTLDPTVGEWVASHPRMAIPLRGQIYSVNDARYFDWPPGLQKYIDTIRQGKGQNPKQYSARYICSLVGDFHRTLLYGGVAMNPRSHLRLVYEANPLAMLVEQAGGRGSDGVRRILSIAPDKLHQRLPLFLGSTEDISELESYQEQGGVQQVSSKTYAV